MIELAIATSIMMIGMVSVVSATMGMHHLRKESRERTLAQNGLRSMAERMHARSYQLSAEPETWSQEMLAMYGPGGTFGDTFEILGLNEDGGRSIGTIQIVVDETQTDQALGFQAGLPRDLNGDGAADDTDVTLDARVLPVLLTVRWTGQSGTSVYRHCFYVTRY